MKKHILFILCSILALNAGAERISRDEAMVLAQDFMKGKVLEPVQTSSSKASVRGGANNESYYIFNAADNGGYAIIAADDRVSPVLGYSDQGNINLDNMPENMASWLEYYEYEINSLKSDANIVLDTPVSRDEIKPMLDNYWRQTDPYNLLCPVYDGIQCPVGCTALAMAQIMYYHKWPVREVDSIPSYINMYNSQLVEGLPATTFKWNLIKPLHRTEETGGSLYAVAELLRYCGQAIETGYETYGSGAYDTNVPKALIERFNYSRQTRLVYKYDYSSYDWAELIYNELASGRPVFYAGYGTLSDGHAFVCDGYMNGYFHINWGGGGYNYNDGYFKLSLLCMDGAEMYDQNNYCYNQQAIIGIEPDKNNLTGMSFTDNEFNYTLLSDTSVMIQAIDGKDYNGIDTLWIPDHVDYSENRYHVTRLGESENLNYDFKKIYLPSSLKQIDTDASFLQTIREFTIPSGIEVLSSTAFWYNESLERFIVENGYTRYKVIDGVLLSQDGKELMCYPRGMKDSCYTVPNGVETIGGYSFYNNKYLSNITLPDCVEHINDWAFSNCSHLKKINLPDNLKDIGREAFANCYNLNDVNLPQNIGTVSKQAFYRCTSLKSIIIPNCLSNCLAARTFMDCSSLEYVYIPSVIEMIGSNCFTGCSALKEIVVESVVPPAFESYSVFDESVYENAVLKVPAGKVELFRNSEIWSKFKNISTIPSYTINGINYILNESAKTAMVSPGQELYSGDIVIPATVEYNGKDYTVRAMQPKAFANCQNLTSVVIDAPVSVLPDSLFNDCSSLKSVILNEGIEKIEYNAFDGCTALETIDIPQSVAFIGLQAFQDCKSLRTVTIPESVTFLGECAFEGCGNLDSVTILGIIKQVKNRIFNHCTNLTYVSLPQNITWIGCQSFAECSNLESITIPENVTIIDDYSFYGCTSLTTIVLPENVIFIGACAFYGCQSLESITIPESVTSIGAKAFRFCQSLKSVTLPDGITFIGNNAFNNCSNLDSIVIPQGMEKIERSAFDLCINLKSVILPESITELDMYAFIECYSLSTITIPANVRKIGNMAFEDCRSMTSFYCCVENPQEIEMGEDVFNRINDSCILYVPQGCAQAYRNDERWNAFSEIREFDTTTSVKPVEYDNVVPVEWYNLSGTKLSTPQRGINIIRYSDGIVRKVIQ